MNGRERATELVAEIAEHLELAGLDLTTTVTLEFDRIPGILDSGSACVTVMPPRQEFPTIGLTSNTWTVLVIAGPVQDQWESWGTIDQIIGALQGPLMVEAAEPADYQPVNGPTYPAYTLTFEETI